MWTIFEKKTLAKSLLKTPIRILKHYELWKRIVELEGPQGLRLVKGFHDEALKGKWKDYRSSRLSLQWRVIYKIEKKQCEVYVIEINPHDYD
ncbi:MAG: type II toxin-antitoxin system mRNA interferase toxin, RelE/StbE family [Pseudomonadota bacterium]